jgi:hypothetical protein
MKKAKITIHSDGSGEHSIDVNFHEWGVRLVPLDNGSFVNETVAIVEYADGKIDLVHPKRVKFDLNN